MQYQCLAYVVRLLNRQAALDGARAASLLSQDGSALFKGPTSVHELKRGRPPE